MPAAFKRRSSLCGGRSSSLRCGGATGRGERENLLLCEVAQDVAQATKDHQVVPDINVSDVLPAVAGFQVSISGRFWVFFYMRRSSLRCLYGSSLVAGAATRRGG